ncbi:MAG TPA: pyridoxal phosphate-dependent aminotransferase [Bacteroidales bacterium]|jgi:aspartate aminotransferase|nr:pyridoxal phosphate-dependent aminotransferase [Bacteroidales bacterium]
METIAQRVRNLAEPEILLMAQRSRDLKAKGLDVISLSIGEPDFDTPQHIKDAAIQAINDNYSHYPPIPGYQDLRKAISDKLLRENGLTYAPSQIVISTGAKQALFNAMFAVVDHGDEVIIPSPFWATYMDIVTLCEGKSVIVRTSIDQSFKITPEQLEKAITPKTKLLMLNSPSNPTGAVYSAEELEKLADIIRKHPQIKVISDEIYELISFSGKPVSIASFPGMLERTIIINGVSKGYAMTGWRIGFTAAPVDIAEACVKIQGQLTSAASSIAQRAALAAYEGPLDESIKMCEAFKRRRDIVVDIVKDIPGLKFFVPEGAFYLFPDVSYYFGKSDGKTTIKDATELTMYLLEHALIATVTGVAFGEPNCLRISFATSDENLRKGLTRMKEALAKLK